MEGKNYINAEGRKSITVEPKEEKYIGQGIAGGKTYEIETEFEGKFGTKKRRFVVKKYHDRGNGQAKDELARFALAKEAGLKVFPTFRISGDGKEAIMTSGFLDEDKVLVGDKEPANTLEYFGEPKIKEIENFDDFLKNYFGQAEIGAAAGLSTHSDAPFFYVSRHDGPRKLDFVLGDAGGIEPSEKYKSEGELLFENILSLESCLELFLKRNISPASTDKYLGELDRYVQDILTNLK